MFSVRQAKNWQTKLQNHKGAAKIIIRVVNPKK